MTPIGAVPVVLRRGVYSQKVEIGVGQTMGDQHLVGASHAHGFSPTRTELQTRDTLHTTLIPTK
jgi:hypothetical protein